MFYVGLALIVVGLFLYFRRKASEPASQPTGPAEATLEDYFGAITRLTEEGYGDGEFAILTAPDKTHFIKVGLTCHDQDSWGYHFGVPSVEWSSAYITKIEYEAKSRGFKAYSVDGTSNMFIDFTDRAAHDAFATWVIREVFQISDDARFYLETS